MGFPEEGIQQRQWAADDNFKRNTWRKKIQDCRGGGVKERVKSLQAVANNKGSHNKQYKMQHGYLIIELEYYNK